MNRLEEDLRDLFLRNEDGVPLVDLGEPEHIARRTRRRQVLVVAGTTLAAVGLAIGAVAGLGAALGSDRSTPALPIPPSEAPVVIERGAYEGWGWVLSASADGRCVALTDDNGSTTLCPTAAETAALGVPESTDLVGVTLRSPGSPGPDSVFAFGIASPRVGSVTLFISHFTVAEDPALFRNPSGIEGGRSFFIGRFDGYPYPVVPEITVFGGDAEGAALDVGVVPLPDWAKPPVTLLDPVTSVSWLPAGGVGTAQDWTFGVWLNWLQGGTLCYPVPSGPCGPREDPVPAWIGSLHQLGVNEMAGSWSQGEGGAFTWGVFHEPVVSVRVELEGQAPFTPDMYPPPAAYPDAPSIFTFEYNGFRQDFRGRVVGLDDEGNVIRTVPL